MNKNLKIGIVGATGLVGQELQEVLVEKGYNKDNFVLMNSYTVSTNQYFDVVFVAATDEASKRLVPKFADRSKIVIDDSSVFRMDKNVPLIIPEVNGYRLKKYNSSIISNPNCAVIPIAVVLDALWEKYSIQSVRVATYQSMSGAGRQALEDFRNKDIRYYDNITPCVGDMPTHGDYCDEEIKIEQELKKILNKPDLPISATCVRVPVEIGHSAVVHVECFEQVDAGDVNTWMVNHDHASVMRAPTVENARALRDQVLVGRIRKDTACKDNGIIFWVTTNNLRKGSALNSVEIMELALQQ